MGFKLNQNDLSAKMGRCKGATTFEKDTAEIKTPSNLSRHIFRHHSYPSGLNYTLLLTLFRTTDGSGEVVTDEL